MRNPSSYLEAINKFIRFVSIYGLKRSFYKALGRLRWNLPGRKNKVKKADIGLIGCGQFGFATIGYFIQKNFGSKIASCFDVDVECARRFAKSYSVTQCAASAEELLENPSINTVYIASNHASHTEYALQAMARGLDVYIEKPISVTYSQLVSLVVEQRRTNAKLYAGYNRPHARAIGILRERIKIDANDGMSIQCFVSGHKIPADHWYRKPEEGTRICGNVGHWINLMVHLFSWRGMPDKCLIDLVAADSAEPDDNLIVTIQTDKKDIFSLMLTSRSEPFEGINESINFQHATTICKIDDFRRMTIWQDAVLIKKRFWPKDVGHEKAILQPFREYQIDIWQQVLISTLLILQLTDMVRAGTRHAEFSINQAMHEFEQSVESARLKI